MPPRECPAAVGGTLRRVQLCGHSWFAAENERARNALFNCILQG